ncbi:MAG: NAD-dependent epimerase/dehydratase family protein [Bacteroidetes bacterium]|nr:NAD-dependent epimerase/dehydratase family protein [Bacteroidota bacterium]MBP6426445.1 NAD-dependent epimerase/dehydratase family protein [Bacteroidia bacterium]MBK8364584.1 NAD-dependent epimerase/dehydratase family protein [Bacteroidota bacterium]MBK9413971.1 NAD-dependent epimerase/dehydratase family protein [Bacteroidota bacterium]MBL0034049.1 NAD-dependent epimerase/dehydratase family protein [Bacteroidota bacterium]
MKRTILVTGGAGFIGSSLAERLARDPDNYVVIVDNLLTGSLSKVPKSVHQNVKFIKADANDLMDLSSIFHAYRFDYVFHYAAVVGVKRTLANPVMVLNDMTGINNVLNLSKNTGVKRVFYTSSSEVYGEPVEFPQNEYTTPLNSRLPYAIVKNVGEAYLRSFKREYDLDFTIFRLFNTYGPKQSSDFVISKFLIAALKDKDITIYGDGSQTRTFCFIEDHLDATMNAFYNNLLVNDVANIGSDNEMSMLELAKFIIKQTNSRSAIVHLPALAEGDMTRRRPDVTKMKDLLNRDFTSLESGLNLILKNSQYVLQ